MKTDADKTRAEIDLGYPRERTAKVVVALCVAGTLAGGIAMVGAGLALLIADWDGPSALVSMNSWLLLAGLGTIVLATRVGPLTARFYDSRLIADADGIRLDARGRRAYTWSQVARFDADTHPKNGNAWGAVVLCDGRRIELHALLEENGVGGDERPGHPVEVADRIRTLNRLLDEARGRS